ncbi:MAG: hypothetical protein GC154_15860 [bacterium]|nr:hypothetical protein [bacterium]
MRRSAIMIKLIIISLPIILSTQSYAQRNFGRTIITAGGFFGDDPLVANSPTLSNPSNHRTNCAFNSINPIALGSQWLHLGQAWLQVPYYKWGISLNSTLFANDAASREHLMFDPEVIVQYFWYESYTKIWDVNGSVVYSNYVPRWTLDGDLLYFADETVYHNDNGNFEASRITRLVNNKWNHQVFDHPGLPETYFWLHPGYPETLGEVGLNYQNFIATYQDTNGELAPQLGYNIKLLVRQDGGACSNNIMLNAASSFGWGTTDIDDWPDPPVGMQLP